MDDKTEITGMTADIVSAFVSNNAIATADIPNLIQSVFRALASVGAGAEAVEAAPREPAVPIRRSIKPDHIVCLEDGREFKSLKRHLRTHYDLSPEEYREKWGLPADYPMVASNYAAQRSEFAKKIGLGRSAPATKSRRRG